MNTNTKSESETKTDKLCKTCGLHDGEKCIATYHRNFRGGGYFEIITTTFQAKANFSDNNKKSRYN